MTKKPDSLQTTLQKIYEAAVAVLSGLLDTSNMYIALYNDDSEIIEFPLVYQDGERVSKIDYSPRHINKRKGLTEWVIHQKKPLLIEKDFDNRVQEKGIKAFLGVTKCWLGAPMMLPGEKVIGVIGLQNFEREGVFDEYHKQLLMTIASQAATAIENARLFELERHMAQERQARLNILQNVSNRMAEAGLKPDEVLQLVAKAANDIGRSDLTAIYLYDQEVAYFTQGVRVLKDGMIEMVENSNDLPAPDGLTAQIAIDQEPLFVNDVSEHPGATDFAQRHQLQAFAGLPLIIAEQNRTTLGVLFVNFEQPHVFLVEEQEILRHLANQAAVAIAYAGAQESAQAKEQLAALGTAAATLQHRLGNTINVILPSVMRLRYRVGSDPTNLKILDTIERNALFATEVIRRMQSPLRQEPFVRVNVNSLLRDAIIKCVQDKDRFSEAYLTTNLSDVTLESSSKPSSGSQISVLVNLAKDLPETFASSGPITEVLRVLVENGIKAIYPKSGVVRIVSKLESNHLRKYINITVSDTGKGIEEKTKTKLFKQPIPRKAFGEGAGLGLWLSKIIVRSHQGTIELFHTEPEKGSTFQVRLPVLNRVPESQQPK